MSGWIRATSDASGDAITVSPPLRQTYPLLERDHSLRCAFRLMLRTLPYAGARLGVILAIAAATIVWLCIGIIGATWLAAHVAPLFGGAWFIGCVAVLVWGWYAVGRYALHLIACGHVAVLTELITRGQIGNGAESQFAYGKRTVIDCIGQETILYGLNAVVRGIVNSFHRTLDWITGELPIPGLGGIASLVSAVLGAATRYLDKVIFSYNLALARSASPGSTVSDPWSRARQGIVYYGQNAKPILKTSVWVVIQEKVLSVLVLLMVFAPAAAITAGLPSAVRSTGSVVTLAIALLLAAAIREALIKPLFLIVIMIRFHALIEHQTVDPVWDARLASLSDRFAALRQGVMPPV